MPGFRKGDVAVDIGGIPYFLRLTLGALAEIDQRLGVKGPLELAAKLKNFSADEQSAQDALTLLECLLRPPCASRAADIPAAALKADPKMFLPAIATLFESSFT